GAQQRRFTRLDLLEHLVFEADDLRHSLDDEVHAGGQLRRGGRRLQGVGDVGRVLAGEPAAFLVLLGALEDGGAGGGPARVVGFDQGHLAAGGGEDVGDADAHRPAADHSHRRDRCPAHASPPVVSPTRGYTCARFPDRIVSRVLSSSPSPASARTLLRGPGTPGQSVPKIIFWASRSKWWPL